MTVAEVMKKIHRACDLLEYYENRANPTTMDNYIIETLKDYIEMLRNLKVVEV